MSEDKDIDKLVKAIDRLSYAILGAALVSRTDLKLTSIDTKIIQKAWADNFYTAAQGEVATADDNHTKRIRND